MILHAEGQVYSQVKYYCDAVIGVLSQCLVAENMGLGPNSKPGAIGRKMAGVVLKVNTKLGGEKNSCSSGTLQHTNQVVSESESL